MATKKQKRAAMEAKRAAFMVKVKEEGLAAQKRDKDERERRAAALQAEAQEYIDRWNAILSSFYTKQNQRGLNGPVQDDTRGD